MAMLRASDVGCWASDFGVTLGITLSGFRGRPTVKEKKTVKLTVRFSIKYIRQFNQIT